MEILQYLLTGATLGLVAGISPGPILALVIRESLQNGRKAGMKVATVPLYSDLPIVLLTLFILTRMSEYNTILGIISFLGAGFILLLAYESIRIKPIQGEIQNTCTGRAYIWFCGKQHEWLNCTNHRASKSKSENRDDELKLQYLSLCSIEIACCHGISMSICENHNRISSCQSVY